MAVAVKSRTWDRIEAIVPRCSEVSEDRSCRVDPRYSPPACRCRACRHRGEGNGECCVVDRVEPRPSSIRVGRHRRSRIDSESAAVVWRCGRCLRRWKPASPRRCSRWRVSWTRKHCRPQDAWRSTLSRWAAAAGQRDYPASLHALLRAEHIAPQQVRNMTHVRELVGHMMRKARRDLTTGELGRLARRVGAIPI